MAAKTLRPPRRSPTREMTLWLAAAAMVIATIALWSWLVTIPT